MSNSYVDNIKVKISEKYKPPFRISVPMSYSQRLTLNKQLQDNRPMYDFHLEKSVIDKMKEWKQIRKNQVEERRQRLELACQEFDKKIQEEKAEKLKEAEAAKALDDKLTDPNLNLTNVYNNVPSPPLSSQDYTSTNQITSSQYQASYITKNGILMPIPATNQSSTLNILKPIPTTSGTYEPLKNTSKPFNISDFESDTSSPFDNMELKSINDLEELAQVLKSNKTNYQSGVYPYQESTKYTSMSYNIPMSYRQNPGLTQTSLTYTQMPNSFSQVSTTITPVLSTYSQYNNPYSMQNTYDIPLRVSNYSASNFINGYMFSNPQTQMTSQVQMSHTGNFYTPYVSSAVQPNLQSTNCKSVPDLVRSLEKELETTHLTDVAENNRHSTSSSYHTTNVPVPVRPKSTDAVYPKARVKDGTLDQLNMLTSDERQICKNLASMGFPLDRVARVCKAVGSDEKKIVDHLLALTQLLDLGFSEEVASNALMKSDNDRDKALDLLIS